MLCVPRPHVQRPLRSVEIDITDTAEMKKIVQSSIGTKFIKKWYCPSLSCRPPSPHSPLSLSPSSPTLPPLPPSLLPRSDLACTMALDAVGIVSLEKGGRKEVDIKRYAKVEKVRGVSREWCELCQL